MKSASEEAMDAFIEELNRLLRSGCRSKWKGYALNPVTIEAYDAQAQIDYATQMILSRDYNGLVFKHVTMDDEVITTAFGETDRQAGINAAKASFTLQVHDILTEGDER